MATIKKIVPSGQISDFRPAAPTAGGGFKLLAGAFDSLYESVLPTAIAQETEKGAALGRGIAQQQIGGNGGQVTASTSGGGHDHGTHDGQSHADWLKYSNQGATRNDPIDPSLIGAMSFLGDMGITMDVISGGQEAAGEGGSRTGSTRHDHGKSADVDFYKNGKKLDWNNPGDLPILKEIVQKSKAGGVTGIGAGDDYMGPGRFHVGFGAPAVWGAGGKSGNAPAWLVEAYNGAPGGGVTASTSGGTAVATPTMMRGADGKLVSKLYNPSSDPIKQAFNLAAGADYQAQIFLKSTTDMMALRDQFSLDPEGFQQAAQSYMDQIVDAAVPMFQGDIRAGLTKDMQQVFLGIVDDKNQEIKQRASNSNMALIEKWSDGLSAAIAGGDPNEIAAAEDQLASVLAVRERLPGAWTPEQSENVVRKTREDGQARIDKAKKEQATEWKGIFSTIAKAAKAGLPSAHEDLLDNPDAAASDPEGWREAMAFTTLRDQMPSFNQLPPKEQAAAIAAARPSVTEDWEIELWGAAEKSAADNAKALSEDPIPRLAEIFPEDPPPPMPDLTDPAALPQWLADRAEYGNRRFDEGFTSKPIFVSKAEAEQVSALFGKDIPADIKFGSLATIVDSMGPDAAGFFDQIGMKDATVLAAGQTLAAGVDPRVAQDALIGRQRLDEGLVGMPADKAVLGGFSADMSAAITSVPGASANFGDMKDLAISIYAATISPNATEREQKAAMETAWKRALGESPSPTGTRGGVQKVGSNPVWLPPNMSGSELDAAMAASFGGTGVDGFGSGLASIWGPMAPEADPTLWPEIMGGSVPMVEGSPITPEMWDQGRVTMLPEGGSKYRLQIIYADGSRSDVRAGDSDTPFIFDADALVTAWRAKAP